MNVFLVPIQRSLDRKDQAGVMILLQQKEVFTLLFSSNASLRCITCHLSGSVIEKENKPLLSSKRNKSGEILS